MGDQHGTGVSRGEEVIAKDSGRWDVAAGDFCGGVSAEDLCAGSAGQGGAERSRAGWGAAVYQLLERCAGGEFGEAHVCSGAELERGAWNSAASVLLYRVAVLDGCRSSYDVSGGGG